MQQRTQGRPNPPPSGGVTPDQARQIIVDGNAETLVEVAQRVSSQMQGSNATTSQLRRLFGEVRRIEMAWTEARKDSAVRRVVLLKPRIHYQAARDRSLVPLQSALVPLIDLVEGDHERFNRLAEFLEAVVAYSK